ncbi:MAG TPA: hypothetical protein VFV50_14975 [Bdellovibrionales bacterium]|nr:hypothetical protein [Bdellovibrionales bacterium]
MIAVGMAHFQSMEPELISEKDVNRLGLSLIGLASVLVSFSIKTYVIGFVLFLLSLIWTAWTARRSFSKKPATFMSLARRRAITAWLTVIDALYSAFVVVHELKYGKNVAAVFMVVFFCLMTYLILLAFTVFGPAPFRGMASGAFRRAYSKWWNQ